MALMANFSHSLKKSLQKKENVKHGNHLLDRDRRNLKHWIVVLKLEVWFGFKMELSPFLALERFKK